MNPTSFETAWTEAELTAFEKLIAAAGSEKNRDAYLGANPGVINAWHFTCAKIGTGGEVFYADDVPSVCFPAYAEMVSNNRASCQKWAFLLAKALPCRDEGNSNVVELRIAAGGIGEIVPGIFKPANSDTTMRIWTLRVDFDLVFETGGKANSATA